MGAVRTDRKMNPDIKRRWVGALRSGKYQQGRGCLRATSDDGTVEHCCLGVLSELWSEETGEDFDGERTFLPEPVRIWAGLRRAAPRAQSQFLAVLNDRGKPFDEIADLIEQDGDL